MNVSIKRVLHFPITKIIIGIVVCFSLFVLIQNFVLKQFFFHLGWNFAQPFYGSNLTGTNDMGSIIQSKFNGPELLTVGAVGIEDSIFTTSFLLFNGIILYYLARKEGKIVKGKLFKK